MRDPPIGKVKTYIRSAQRFADWVGCVVHIRSELARLALSRSDLTTQQSSALYAIEDGVNETHLNELFHWWN